MAYREFRTYQGGTRLELQHAGAGIWSIAGPRFRAFTPPGTSRDVAHRRADIIADAEPISAWAVDDAAIVSGDDAPCHTEGCRGHYMFQQRAHPGQPGAVDALIGTCSADAEHVYLARQ